MNEPNLRPMRAQAAPRVATPSRLSHWRDDARRFLLQPVLRLGALLGAWRRRGRDHAELQGLGARELRDIGLVRRDAMTAGERALGRL